MPTLTVTKSYADAALLSGSDLNSFIDSIQNFFNVTKIDATNIADSGVSSAILATNSVTDTRLADLAVLEASLASEAATTTRILDANVTAAKLADQAATTAKVVNSAGETAALADEAVTWSKAGRRSSSTGPVTAGNVGISASSGTFISQTSLGFGYVGVTNLSVTITTTGRPVRIKLMSATGGTSYVNVGGRAGAGIKLLRDFGTEIMLYSMDQAGPSTSGGNPIPTSSLKYLDNPAAGTYTYSIQVLQGPIGQPAVVYHAKLVAWEI